MELVAGCYEQVLFGFAVHPESKVSGDREVSAEGPPQVWAQKGLACFPQDPGKLYDLSGSDWRIKLRRLKYKLAF